MSSEDIPECLSNRNKALNVLVQDVLAYVEDASNSSIGMAKPPKSNEYNSKEPVMVLAAEEKGCDEAKCPIANTDGANCKDDAISTLMCDFWRILKDEPHFKLPQDLRSKVCVETCTGSSCSGKGKKSKSETSSTEGKTESLKSTPEKGFNVPITIEPTNHDCGVTTRTNVPLRKALSNLKDAASFEKSCAERMTELLTAQQSLTEQVQNLEEKERQGTLLLKKADCMWSCMEEQYKRQVEEKKETYKMLQNQKKEIDTNINKWRKTLKDLELKKKTLDTTSQEMAVKTIQKENDIKVLELEIESFKKRVARNADDLEAVQNSYNAKKKASEARVEKITDEMQKFQERVGDECQCKKDKEHEGAGYVKEARDDLQKICRCLLQKKLENEDLRAEKEALLQEIDLLKTTSETCSDRCKRREKNIVEETKRIDKEISDYQVKCKQCHKFTDSADLTGYCIDCPRCLIKRNCLIKGEECFSDHTKDCVCTRVKEKFLDNVFENMYSVLEKQAKTCPGKEVADCIFTCLERSRNGKLDEDTRKILQEFILSTVRNNLNLTIIGGAVKTRCEMDPEMYGQLMLCLKDVTVTKPVKADKATVSRKPPCKRWKDTSECNCPQGPKNCPCTKKAPKQPTEPGSCGQPDGREEEMEYSPTTLPGAGLWKRDPCEEGSCAVGMYGTNMRAAQCMLGPEALSKVRAHSKRPTPPTVPSVNFTNKKATRIIGNKAVKSCHTDDHEQSRLKMIEGVMGSYSEVSPIEEVRVADQHCEMCAARGKYSGCDCARLPTQNKKKELTIPYNYNLLIDKVLCNE